MFQQLVNHNGDIARLLAKGYAISSNNNYLVVRDIPYLDADMKLARGALVAKLVFVDEERVVQDDHQVFFAGSAPHGLDGRPVGNLADRPAQLALGEACLDVVVQRRFSNKPQCGSFKDFFDKIESYVAILSGPAMAAFPEATPFTYRVAAEDAESSVFSFRDTLTSRAEITDLSTRFHKDVVAIIGLGGTGAYVLDLLVKTPVKEIRAYDLDSFHVHTAFRSPGGTEQSEFCKTKAEVYRRRYASFRSGLVVEPMFIDASCGEKLEGVTFAFVCVDTGASRKEVFDLLISNRIPFLDVGLGLRRREGCLNGMIRTTYFPDEGAELVRAKRLAPENDSPEDAYRTNIQIAELNALNACLAVIRFKQVRGFYLEDESHESLLLEIADLRLVS